MNPFVTSLFRWSHRCTTIITTTTTTRTNKKNILLQFVVHHQSKAYINGYARLPPTTTCIQSLSLPSLPFLSLRHQHQRTLTWVNNKINCNRHFQFRRQSSSMKQRQPSCSRDCIKTFQKGATTVTGTNYASSSRSRTTLSTTPISSISSLWYNNHSWGLLLSIYTSFVSDSFSPKVTLCLQHQSNQNTIVDNSTIISLPGSKHVQNNDNNNNENNDNYKNYTNQTKRKTWLQRLLEWIKDMLRQLYSFALLTIRGSEIIVRLSPLVILIPASIISAYIIQLYRSSRSNGSIPLVLSLTKSRKTAQEDDEDKVEYAPIKRLRTQVRINRRLSSIRSPDNNTTSSSSSSSMTVKNENQYYHHLHPSSSNNSIITSTNSTNTIADWTWEYFTYSMYALGPAYVKLCQWIATRRDIFPPNVCDRLAHLHDHGMCHNWDHTHNTLVRAFGPNYEALGLSIEHDPKNKYVGVIGSGSAAQVYKGVVQVHNTTTTNNNDDTNSTTSPVEVSYYPVAIKVLHPRFEERVEQDLWFLQSIADMIHYMVPSESIRMLNLPRAVTNFGTVLQLQSDLRCEATNLIQFRTNFYGTGTETESAIFFPKPIQGWISKEVLVEQLVENSSPISEYLLDNYIEGDEDDLFPASVRKELAIPLLNAFLKMVFIDNFVHCDLHPGNVLVRKYYVQSETDSLWNKLRKALVTTLSSATIRTESSSNNTYVIDKNNNNKNNNNMEMKRQIVFLDAGIAFHLDNEAKQNLLDLFRAVVTNNGKEAGRLMVERAKYERCSSVPGGIEAFSSGIGDIVSEFHDRRKDGLTLGVVRIGSLLTRVLDLCRIHGVEIDPAMANVIISTLVLEGLGRSLEPSLNLIDFAMPFILGGGRV